MKKKAYLILESGTVFEGYSFGKEGDITGEIVFTTAMTGYLETLTDPSYYGQIILQTFPLIGNYGVIPNDFECGTIHAKAYIVKEVCQEPFNFRSEGDLDAFLKDKNIVGLYGIDTRALTSIIRKNGVMNGRITLSQPDKNDLSDIKAYAVTDAISTVSSSQIEKLSDGKHKIALMDYGAKRGISESLKKRDCEVWNFPYNSTAEEILDFKPNGIMLSNGPGNPADPANTALTETISQLKNAGVPIFGICLGHQLLAIANGYSTRKLKFGHRGANQPVKDTRSGRVYITSQNHGYEVIADTPSFINVNDGSCEGLDYRDADPQSLNFSVQFHPEACGGPLDTSFLFDEFIRRIETYAS